MERLNTRVQQIQSPWDNGPKLSSWIQNASCRMGFRASLLLAALAVYSMKPKIEFASNNLILPRKRITINLAPTDLPKENTTFDLAVATAILAASEQLLSNPSGDEGFISEVDIDGSG